MHLHGTQGTYKHTGTHGSDGIQLHRVHAPERYTVYRRHTGTYGTDGIQVHRVHAPERYTGYRWHTGS